VIVFGSVVGLLVALVVLVALVLFYKYKGRGQKLASINKALDSLAHGEIKLPEEEVKKMMGNLNKAHRKVMFPKIHVEFDGDEDFNEEPVIMFTQFLRDSFVEGFKSDNKSEFMAALNKINDKVPKTRDDTRHSAGDGNVDTATTQM
jgi:hypothetical protein